MEIIGEIISNYSNIRTGETSSRVEYEGESAEVLENEKEFWGWFCKRMEEENFRKCFLETKRDDYYGSLKQIKEKYPEKCKK